MQSTGSHKRPAQHGPTEDAAFQRPKQRSRANKMSSDEIKLHKELREWDYRLDRLQRYEKYRQAQGEMELENLVTKWRAIAQNVAEDLLSLARNRGDISQEEDDDEMAHMLTLLRVDLDLIRYSRETGDFY
ncbi:uncharacterized protein BYT42DRAFT_616370 [Radiomyces spectabilis]|uniref:uncharacterized protein n=1 Tax=Radiomyces spectabilis TaxID=64574 RepID=UPI002220B842|nr:uncharacterized protein BYT42DRAFT_616370 [Radiomyces spectabilis]KAI8373201.1 hypothetical protein BYT42DRAFT_616370 [Radiomyces spectabilis]